MRILGIITFWLLLALPVFAQAGSISGRVTFGGSKPLHDVTIRVVQTRQTATSDEDGNYRLSDIAPGRYTIIAHLEGFSDSLQTVTVAANAEITLDFTLQVSSLREEVTVTASGAEQSISESFQTVNSVGVTRIMEKASTSIGDVLESETGVAKRSFGPGSSRPVIRGFDGDRVLVLEDGIRSGSAGSQSGDHGEPIDPLSADRIEVVKGPGTLLYGSNALGGVVNAIAQEDGDYHDGFRTALTGIGGTADDQGAFSGNLEYGRKRWLFRGSLSAQRSGDYDSPVGKIQNSGARSNTENFGVGYYGAHSFFNGSYGLDIRRYGIPFAPLFEEGGPITGEIPILDEEIDIRQRRHNFRFNGGFSDLQNSVISGVKYTVSYTNYRQKEIEISDGIDDVATIINNKTFTYRTLFEQQKHGRLTGRFGVEGFNRNYEINGAEQLIVGEIDHNSFSVFGLEELNLERVKFQFGGRIERNSYNPENPDLLNRTITGISGAAGINVGLWAGGVFVANYSHSSRSPALEELYNNGPHVGNLTFEVGNQNLRRESSNGIDLSLRHQSNRFRFTGDFFYYRINNFVFLADQDQNLDGEVDFEDGLRIGNYEQADARYVGGEISAELTFNRFVSGFANLDTVRAKLTERDINLPRIPPSRARLGLNLQFGGLSLRPEAVLASDQNRTFPLETRTPGYGIINVGGSYIVGSQHHAHIITFNAYNLTDKLYRNHVSFIKDFAPEIGRGLRVGYTIRFF